MRFMSVGKLRWHASTGLAARAAEPEGRPEQQNRYDRPVSKTRALGFLGSLSLLLALFVVLPGMGADQKDKDGKTGLYRPLGLFTEVLALVRSNYVEPVEVKPLLVGAFSGMTEAMDPFSEYIAPEKMPAFTAYLAAKEKKESVDAGLVLARRFGYPVVVSAISGSPAAVAGLKSDDVIEKIGDRAAHALGLWEVESMLAGKAGGKVRLLIVREGGKPRRRTIDIIRSTWAPESPSASRVDGETVVRIPSFVPGTAAKIAAIVSPLDRTKPILLDVRGNAFGDFEEAARASALFVEPGPLGELKGRKIATVNFRAEPGQRIHASRLVVLVDSGTGGPAELFAASLRESALRESGLAPSHEPKRTVTSADDPPSLSADSEEPAPVPESLRRKGPVRLVGETTIGMGFSSQTVKLASGGSLRLSVGKIRTSSGRSLSPKGLEPDDRVYAIPEVHGAEQPAVDSILKRGLKVLAETTTSTAKIAA
jgi:carboxyl-terminal processing protease